MQRGGKWKRCYGRPPPTAYCSATWRRCRAPTRVREQAAGLPPDERVASAYIRLAAGDLAAGRKPRVHDTWIAATALRHNAAVLTQDDDFTSFSAIDILRV